MNKSISKQKKTLTRKVVLKPTRLFQKVLIISDFKLNEIQTLAKSIFSDAEIFTLYQRKEKLDNSTTNEFAVHNSDFNLTGKIKNDKLNQLLQMNFDLVIDLHQNSKSLYNLMLKLNASLFIGRLDQIENEFHDLYFNFKSNEHEFLKTIEQQITLLTKNEHKKF